MPPLYVVYLYANHPDGTSFEMAVVDWPRPIRTIEDVDVLASAISRSIHNGLADVKMLGWSRMEAAA